MDRAEKTRTACHRGSVMYIEYSGVSSNIGTFMKSMLDMNTVMCEENNSDEYHF